MGVRQGGFQLTAAVLQEGEIHNAFQRDEGEHLVRVFPVFCCLERFFRAFDEEIHQLDRKSVV